MLNKCDLMYFEVDCPTSMPLHEGLSLTSNVALDGSASIRSGAGSFHDPSHYSQYKECMNLGRPISADWQPKPIKVFMMSSHHRSRGSEPLRIS